MATRYRFGLEEYEERFRGVRNVELLKGEVYQMSPIGPKHAWNVARLTRLFTEALRDRAVVWPRNPIRIPPHSEPQPDLALLKPRDYGEALPAPEDVLLLPGFPWSADSLELSGCALVSQHRVPKPAPWEALLGPHRGESRGGLLKLSPRSRRAPCGFSPPP